MKKQILSLGLLVALSVNGVEAKPKDCCEGKDTTCEKHFRHHPPKEGFNKEAMEKKFKEYKESRNASIIKEVGFTTEEGEKVFAMYDSMKKEQMEKEKKMREKIKGMLKNEKQYSEKEYNDALNELLALHREREEKESAFYTNLSKTYSAEKAFKFRMAEEHFLHSHLRGMHGKSMKHNPRKK